MKWIFEEWPHHLVKYGVTQVDQFHNEEVDLADTLVRETVQNSLDARHENETVKVSFQFLEGDSSPSRNYMKKIFEGYLEHAEAAGIDLNEVDLDNPTALIIEDFGTVGLTGNYKDPDGSDNFHYFWRSHGLSGKKGIKLGRRGLGKLVFPVSSRLRCFFGLTIGIDYQMPLLMGMSVFDVFHKLKGKIYPPHNYFAELVQIDQNGRFQVPLSDQKTINEFINEFRLKRTHHTGLSIVVPFPKQNLKLEEMIKIGIINYFIPILRGQLILEFGDNEFNSSNLLEKAKGFADKSISDFDELFRFVLEVNTTKKFVQINEGWIQQSIRKVIPDQDLEKIREVFSNGGLVAAQLPIEIKKRNNEHKKSFIRIFLKRPDPPISKGQDYYVRSQITLPAESRFGMRKSFGLLLAEDPPVVEFLGDAENPAHTKWNSKAEPLKKYMNARTLLKGIRNSLIELHDLLVQAQEERDEDAFLDLLYIPGEGAKRKQTKAAQTLCRKIQKDFVVGP